MRTIIVTILVWAVLLGFLATGIKVMASSPTPGAITGVSEATGHVRDLQRIDIDRNSIRLGN